MASPTILGRMVKQSGETLDYDVDYTDWFENRTDDAASHTATAETGITVVTSSLASQIVRVVLSGGTDGETYKITVRVTTNAATPIIKEADFTVRIKDV
jgi:hypothetical protein